MSTILGVYVGTFNNSDPSEQATVDTQYNTFVSAMGQAPTMIDTYIDDSKPESEWAANAQWAAASLKADSNTTNAIPLIALPMASSDGESADQSFQNIISGSEDSVFNGIFQAYANAGYSSFYLRPGWEMNGTWFSWSVTSSNAADYVAAFQHIATLAHDFSGAKISVVWSPNVGATAVPWSQTYPGNSSVDVVGIDTYGQPVNNDTSPADTSTDPTNYTLLDALALAKDNGKPFGFGETGGVDPTFPTQLASTVAAAGVPVAFMDVWDSSAQGLSWSAPSDNNAATAAAWNQAFATISGASGTAATPAATTSTTTSATTTSDTAASTTAAPASTTPTDTGSSTSASVTVTAGGAATTVSATGNADGDSFTVSGTTINAVLGSGSTALAFAGTTAVTLTGGSGAATVSVADSGADSFTAGSGALTVTGGSGADAYVYGRGDGLLTITDFSAAKGDTLTISKGLDRHLSETSDGNGGTLLSFAGRAGGIDLQGVTSLPTIIVH
jgi:hypothetical protein